MVHAFEKLLTSLVMRSATYSLYSFYSWAFDGMSGECVDIPQVASIKDVKEPALPPSKPTFPARSCANAVPAQIHQEMVYLFPFGSAEEALVAPPPPSIPEYDEEGFHVSSSIRDMPVDWPIVVSNICDADHGLFAHQSKAFDMYAASKDYPMQVTQDFPDDGKSWTMSTKVDSTDKLNEIDRLRRGSKPKEATKETPWATTYFEAPFHLQMKRVDRTTNRTKFITTFYICPVGVGRARFMGGALGKKVAPRWVVKLGLDNFLDQDTYLLATQQHHILSQEAKDVREMLKNAPGSTMEDKIKAIESKPMPTRRTLFCLSSPTDALGAKLERFWDATLLRSPNRITNLLKLDEAGAFLQTPPRSFVLDRKKQVLDVSPDHQAVVRNCETIRKVSMTTLFVVVMTKVLAKTFLAGMGVAIKVNAILKPSLLAWTLGASSFLAFVGSKILREYEFKYTETFRRNDMRKIPKLIWEDR